MIILFSTIITTASPALAQKEDDPNQNLKTATEEGYTYQYVENDPYNARIYTLKNGLKIYLSVNPEMPRIQSAITIKAGSKNDPRNNTGLAHYLEHLLFKGTDKIGTANWEKESPLLKKIEDLYEKHKNTTDPKDRAAIYKEIDNTSQEAAKYALANEYDKMAKSIGGEGTNAYTTNDQTVYLNDVPTNELEKLIILEAERFKTFVPRLFHTELETVYEEYNRAQDSDGSKVYYTILQNLFKNHPYHVSTIGLPEHLKSPSQVAIHQFFDTYYVPNNMAVCLAGDLNPTKTVQLIEKYFGSDEYFKPAKPIPAFVVPTEEPIQKPLEATVLGKDAEGINIVFRTAGANTPDEILLDVIAQILTNGQAGLIDLNLVKAQKVLSAGSYANTMHDYGMFVLYGRPRQNQTLEQLQTLLLEQLEALKKGNFDEKLINGIVKDLKYQTYKIIESNDDRAQVLSDAFVHNRNWKDVVEYTHKLEKITKQQIIDFANQQFKNNYLTVFKKIGDDPNIAKVDKPAITPVTLQRAENSTFLQKFEQIQTNRLEPVFLDFNEEVQKSTLKNKEIPFYYVKNQQNPTFNLYYYVNKGNNADKKLSIALRYLSYLGTDKFTAAELQTQLYKLGLSFDASTQYERTYIRLFGLEESLAEGIQLIEYLLNNVQPNEDALQDLINGMLKERQNAKLNKNYIFNRALYNYAMYGSQSEFTNILTNEELKSLKATELVQIIKDFLNQQHYIAYYGTTAPTEVKKIINKHHKAPKKLKPLPTPTLYPEKETTKPTVFFVDMDMVQAQIGILATDETFNTQNIPYAYLFGEYFGGGLSSIVFQEIREARALAYSAFANYSIPEKLNKKSQIFGFVGTQADKMEEALNTFMDLLQKMPQAERQFEAAKIGTLKSFETDRTPRQNIFSAYLRAQDRNLNYDIRKDAYQKIKDISIQDLNNFFQKHITKSNYNLIVMGSKKKLNLDVLNKFGAVEEVTLEQILGY